MAVIWVALGGAIGASLRFGISQLAVANPWVIAAINVMGSFLMGFLALRLAGQDSLRLFLATGILGGFTTFSAFSLDAVNFISKGETWSAMVYTGSSVGLSILACCAGLALARVQSL